MKYKIGQVVVINKDTISTSLYQEAKRLSTPYVSTIQYIQPDPHSGNDMYMLEGCISGWYEEEIKGLYFIPEKINSRFEILDL